ncbi:unnamed protein product [Heterobilharzia americana]|nr:unnamed protein product [Heterobilharzia americana]
MQSEHRMLPQYVQPGSINHQYTHPTVTQPSLHFSPPSSSLPIFYIDINPLVVSLYCHSASIASNLIQTIPSLPRSTITCEPCVKSDDRHLTGIMESQAMDV